MDFDDPSIALPRRLLSSNCRFLRDTFLPSGGTRKITDRRPSLTRRMQPTNPEAVPIRS